MDFDEIVDTIGNPAALGYSALGSWGYTRQEAAHEVLVEAWELAISGKTIEHPAAFIKTCLCNREIDNSRRLWGATVALDENMIVDEGVQLSLDDRLKINRLSHKHRAILFLFYFVGYDQYEIAKKLNIAVGTVKSRLNRARKKLSGAR